MKSIGLLIIIFLSACILKAQVNTEFLRRENLGDGWFNSFALSFGYYSGNSDFVRLRGDYRTDLKSGSSSAFLIGNIEYAEGNNKLIVHKGFAHLRYAYSVISLLIPEVFIQKEFNRFILLSDRNLMGAGLRLHLINHNPLSDSLSKVNLYMGVGGMWENEKISAVPNIETSIFRSTNYINFDWDISSIVNLQAVSYFQVDVKRFSDHRILSDATLSFALTKNLKFLASLHYRFDNEPPAGIKKYDLEISNGIRVDL